MGVYIKGIDKPKECYDCPFNTSRDWSQTLGICIVKVAVFVKEPLHEPGEWWCPLEAVPPHGDLIDRDEVMKKHSSWIYEGDGVCESIKAATVVIPADKEV